MDITSQDATRPYVCKRKQESATHQAPQERSSASEAKRGTKEGIRGASVASLLSELDRLADEMNEKASQMSAVAYGGQAYSSGPDYRGDPIDSICEGMFSAILGISSDASPYIYLKDAIAELSYVVSAGQESRENLAGRDAAMKSKGGK